MPKYSHIRVNQKQAQKPLIDASLDANAQTYIGYLKQRGYAQGTISGYSSGVVVGTVKLTPQGGQNSIAVDSVVHFIYWLSLQRTQLSQINETLIEHFLDRHLPQCRCAPRCRRSRAEMSAALAQFLVMLRTSGTCSPRSPIDSEAISTELTDLNRYFVHVCELSQSTCTTRRRHIRAFLIAHFKTDPIQISRLISTDVAGFVMRYTQGMAPGSVKALDISLRSYFRFKASQGVPTTALIAALPRVAQWRLVGLPDVLSAAEIKRFVNAFDRTTATGKRDYAIARCFLDLGLRRVEVAHLELENVDWRTGTLYVHGKGQRVDVVPLPWSTGEAIADYLRHGRPTTTRRELFVRHRPPINAPADLDIVRNAVRYAAQRCGLQDRIRGTHIFRHTAACQLVQAGTPFKEIADLLRHRSPPLSE